MDKKTNLIKNTVIILIGKICTQLISFLLLPLYTSYLVSSEYGIVDLITTYVSLLVPIISLQLEMAVFRFLVDSRKDEEYKNKILSTDLLCLLFFIFIGIFLFIVVNSIVNIKYSGYIIGIIIVTMIMNNFMQIARGIGNNTLYSFSSFIVGSSTVILNVAFIVGLNMGVRGMLLAMLIANLLSSIYLFFKLKLYKINVKNYDKKILKELLKYSLPLIPNGISWWVMNASDRTIVSMFLGISYNGIYAVSNKFPSLLNSFFGIFNLAWSEDVSINIESEDKENYISSVCNDILNVFSYLGILMITFLALTFKFFVNESYAQAYYYIPILVVASFFSLMAAQYGSLYIAKKETKKIAYTTLVSALINIVSHLILIKFIKLYAAAISTLLSYFIIMLYRHYDTKRFIKINYNKRNIIKYTVLCIIAMYFYYLKNYYINIILFVLFFILSIFENKKYIIKIYKKLTGKIKGKNNYEKE